MPESPTRSGSRTALLSLPLIAALLLTTLATAAPAGAAAIKAARMRYAPAIEPFAAYQPQTTCSPSAKPGVVDFSRRLMRAYPTTRSLGIVRACSAGGRSEHKEGRAFDWSVNARSAADRARVARTMTWLMAPDKFGNRNAMARRLGIQYVIWNRKIWGAYAADSGWRKYRGASPHTDHVHFSFTWAGARKATSFWTGKVGNIHAAPTPSLPPVTGPIVPPSDPVVGVPVPVAVPVPTPRPTVPRTPRPTVPAPRPVPLPAASLLPGDPLEDETVTVPAAGGPVLTTGALQAGQEYLLEVSGTYAYGSAAGQVADAECSTSPTDPTWRRDRSVHPSQAYEDHLDLYVDGGDLFSDADVNAGGNCDTRSHTYRDTITPTRTGRVTLELWDPTTLADNSGALTVRILAVTARDRMDWQVPATAAAGVTSPGALAAGVTYLMSVTGTVDAGGGVTADAECSVTVADPVWRRDRSVVALEPTADSLDALLDRAHVTYTGVTDPDRDGCDSTGHAYRRVLTPSVTGPVNLRVDDPEWADNSGALAVHVERVDPVVGPETVALDAAAEDVDTARNYLAGQALRITASGTYAYGPGVTADAECSATVADPVWRSTRSELYAEGRYLGDVTVNGRGDWTGATGARCDPGHAYTWTYTPTTTGPLRLGVLDSARADNVGTLTLTIAPAV